MQFVYHPSSGQETLRIDGETYNYIFKVRRHKRGEIIPFRNMRDGWLYYYRIDEVDRKRALLTLVDKELKEIKPSKYFHLIWCVIDPKSIEKTLPALNELGVGKITFVYCDRSQKNFKLRFEKLQKILINSSQQCGRSDLMELELMESLEGVVQRYGDVVLIDFCEEKLKSADNISRALIGPEGGVSEDERKRFEKILGLDTPLVLRSETAAVGVSAKVLL